MAKEQTIKTIFTNLLFVIGVIITVIGFIRTTQTVTKLIVFDKYPIGYQENCKAITRPPIPDQTTPSLQNQKQQEQNCLSRQKLQRQERKVSDITTSISTLIAGSAIILFFRRFIFS